MTNTIQIGQQFKQGNQLFTVAFIESVLTQVNDQFVYNVSIRLDAEYGSRYFKFTSPTEEIEAFCLDGFEYIGVKKDCGCVLTKDGELNTPCAEHFERIISAAIELDVEQMWAGKFN